MKTYLRILTYAKPIGKFLFPYFLFTLLSVVFGLLNFTLLAPLFEVLFGVQGEANIPKTQPVFDGDIPDYIYSSFYYYFGQYIERHGAMGGLRFVVVLIIIAVLLANVFRYLSSIIVEKVKVTSMHRLRYDLFQKTIDLHLGYFSEQRKGDLMSRLNTDVQQVEGSVAVTFMSFVRDPITIISYFVLLFILSTRLTLFTLIIIPLSGFLIASLLKRIREAAKKSQKSLGYINSLIDEAFGAIRVVKAFNGENYIKNTFYSQSRRYANILFDMQKKHEITSPISEFLGVSVVVGILLYGGSLVLAQDPKLAMSPSNFVVYVIAFSQVIRPAKQITNSFSTIQRGIASGQRIFSLMDTKPEIVDKPNARYLDRLEEKIEFKNVVFGYDPSVPVLKGLHFTINKGETVALVGPSGGGKSTTADLLPRFYDPNEGGIFIDGIDLRDYQVTSVRERMGIVTQECILFNDTIFNNIAFCKTDATMEEVEHAAKIANAHTFIEHMEDGYFTRIGDRGLKLSGGQRQRISIARAVLLNPEILILDEATSSLDTESEKLVQDALNHLMANRTSLVIAHRLSTIQHADKILVIEDGKIVESGNHHELMEVDKGVYRRLNMMQSLA